MIDLPRRAPGSTVLGRFRDAAKEVLLTTAFASGIFGCSQDYRAPGNLDDTECGTESEGDFMEQLVECLNRPGGAPTDSDETETGKTSSDETDTDTTGDSFETSTTDETICGNGIVEGDEECDGGEEGEDFCSDYCKITPCALKWSTWDKINPDQEITFSYFLDDCTGVMPRVLQDGTLYSWTGHGGNTNMLVQVFCTALYEDYIPEGETVPGTGEAYYPNPSTDDLTVATCLNSALNPSDPLKFTRLDGGPLQAGDLENCVGDDLPYQEIACEIPYEYLPF